MFGARADVGARRHTKTPKELSRHNKADSFQITAKLQRRMVCGSERREGVLCFNASLIIIVRGMDCWTGKDLSHISHPQRTMLQRQKRSFYTLCGKEEELAENKTKAGPNVYRRPQHDMRCCIPAGKHDQNPHSFSSLLDRMKW